MESPEEAAGKTGGKGQHDCLVQPGEERRGGQGSRRQDGGRRKCQDLGANVLQSDLAGLFMLIKGRKQRGSHVL